MEHLSSRLSGVGQYTRVVYACHCRQFCAIRFFAAAAAAAANAHAVHFIFVVYRRDETCVVCVCVL